MIHSDIGTSHWSVGLALLAALCIGVAAMGCQSDRAGDEGVASSDLTMFEPLPNEAPALPDNPATVERENNRQFLYADIVDALIECTLEEG